jgi:tRNA A-37 threonylcarbamoyl transferase component Bud32
VTQGPSPLETVGERYLLVELVSAGDGHETWHGHDDLASRPVAVTRYLNPTVEWRSGFDRRARALEALSDPGIASTLRHDADDDRPWVVSAWVEGSTVSAITADEAYSVDDALAVLGQTALALAAAHGAGIGHGRLDTDHIVVRPDGSTALIGFVTAVNPPLADDRAALGVLARTLLPAAAVETDDDVRRLLTSIAEQPPEGPGRLDEIARTALSLAAGRRAGAEPRPKAAATNPGGNRPALPASPRPWYDEAERKRVRNRLIALGAIVVLGGAVLLRILSSGAGQTTVPSVIGLPFVQAQEQLNEVGLRASETITTGRLDQQGTVIDQDPAAGSRAKVGTLVVLTVVAGG